MRDADSARMRLEEGLRLLGISPSRGERWAIKLNLVIPYFVPGICSGPEVLEGLCRFAADRGLSLQFVEGDGGNRKHTAEEAFRGNGVDRLVERFGFSCLNVCRLPSTIEELSGPRGTVRLPVSAFFVDRPFDRFISLALFKTHVFTGVSLTAKNLWGCIPDGLRMYYHHVLDDGIVALVARLRPDIAIVDGVVSLDGNGPINGTPRRTEALLLGDDAFATDCVGTRLMGIDPRRIGHLRLALDSALLDEGSISADCAPDRLLGPPFRLRRRPYDRASQLVMRSPLLQRLIYHSPLSPILYAAVAPFRRGSVSEELRKRPPTGD